MWPNLQFPADLVTFTEETLYGKFHFLCIGYTLLLYSQVNHRGNRKTLPLLDLLLILEKNKILVRCLEDLLWRCSFEYVVYLVSEYVAKCLFDPFFNKLGILFILQRYLVFLSLSLLIWCSHLRDLAFIKALLYTT